MPHIIIEHSSQFAPVQDLLVAALHEEATQIVAFPIGGLRVRAYQPGAVKVGDGDPDHAFAYVTVRLGKGRDDATKREIGERLFARLTAIGMPLFGADDGVSYGLEIQEIDSAWTWKQNNIHTLLKGT